MGCNAIRDLRYGSFGHIDHGVVLQSLRDNYYHSGNRTAHQDQRGVVHGSELSEGCLVLLFSLPAAYVNGWVFTVHIHMFNVHTLHTARTSDNKSCNNHGRQVLVAKYA